MATKSVTDLGALTSAADDDLLMIVDVSDTTGSAEGTSKKITKANLGGGGGPSKTMVNGSFFDNAIRSVYLPVGNTETEYTTVQRSNKFAMPYAGQLKRVMVRSEYSAPSSGTYSMSLRLLSATSNTVTTIETITVTPTYLGVKEMTFEFTSTAAMLEGRTYAFYFTNQTNTASGNVNFTIVIEQ